MTALVCAHMLIQLTPFGALPANQHWALIHEGLHQRLPQWQLHVLCALFGSIQRTEPCLKSRARKAKSWH